MRYRMGYFSMAVYLCLVLALMFPPGLEAKVFRVNTTKDAVDSNPGNGECLTAEDKCSLRAAVMEANTLSGADEILLRGRVYKFSLAGAGENFCISGDLDISDHLTITGAGRKKTFINGGRIDRVLEVTNTVTVKLRDLTIQNGQIGTLGGGIYNQGGGLTIYGCAVSDNIVRSDAGTASGGGLANAVGGTMTMKSSKVTGNLPRGVNTRGY